MVWRTPLLAALLAALVAFAACAPMPDGAVPQRQAPAIGPLPPMQRFVQPQPQPPQRSNREIAHDFLELSFFMESGREIPRISRFEGPITLRLTGPAPDSARTEVSRLIRRFRDEAGIAIEPAPAGRPAAITVEFVGRAQLRGVVPQAACFVVPRVSSWDEFRRHRRSPRLDWTTVSVREHVAVFVPHDVTPQEVRDCLHEEIAQAMGPLNDLYRLHDSVFNDDNFQGVLTGFDMLILRAYYAPELRSGMTRAEVAARLPGILARLNPRGEQIASRPLPARSPRSWIEAVETALGPATSRSGRRAAAERAVRIAREQGWSDNRLAFIRFTLGRLARAAEADLALAAFLEAGTIYAGLPGAEVHAAHVDMQMAAFALSMGRYEDVLRIARRAQPAARSSENAALLASLQMVQAEALDRLGRTEDARVMRLDSLSWARYGFGPDERVRERLSEIAALAPEETGG
jgi:hypothetical protein